MLHHMSKLVVDSGQSSAGQYEQFDNQDLWNKKSELASAAQKIEVGRPTKEGNRLMQLYEMQNKKKVKSTHCANIELDQIENGFKKSVTTQR